MVSWEPIHGETPIDPSQLVPRLRGAISSRAELNVEEFRSIQPVYVKYLAAKPTRRQAPFTLDWVYKLHYEMFRKVWVFAGKRRSIELNIGVDPYLIDTQLHALLEEVLYWRDHKTYPIIEQAARLHHRSVQIHPFENGNGRWSRLLANIWLKQQGEPIIQWSDVTIGETSVIRKEYIRAVKAADESDYTPLIKIHKQYSAKPHVYKVAVPIKRPRIMRPKSSDGGAKA